MIVESAALYSAFSITFLVLYGLNHPVQNIFLQILPQIEVRFYFFSHLKYPQFNPHFVSSSSRLSSSFTVLLKVVPGHLKRLLSFPELFPASTNPRVWSLKKAVHKLDWIIAVPTIPSREQLSTALRWIRMRQVRRKVLIEDRSLILISRPEVASWRFQKFWSKNRKFRRYFDDDESPSDDHDNSAIFVSYLSYSNFIYTDVIWLFLNDATVETELNYERFQLKERFMR